jgi:hypothetical protein
MYDRECILNWGSSKISYTLLMDIKAAFEDVSRTHLTDRLQDLDVDLELVRSTNSFMME